jgi:hypothetical protein
MNFKIFQNAFDKIGSQSKVLEEIGKNTKVTATSVSVGGDLYTRIDNLVTAIEGLTGIASGKSKKSGGSGLSVMDSIAVAIMAPALKPIGKGLGFIIEALNKLEDGEAKAKGLEAIVKVLQSVAGIGKSIFVFAGYMALSLPFLLIAAVSAPIFAMTLFLVLGAVRLATKFIDVKAMESLKSLKDIGLGILVFAGSLALASFIMPYAIKGAFGAAGVILLIGGVFVLLAMTGLTDTIEETAKGLMFAGLAILSIGIALALFSIIEPYAMAGMMSAAKIIFIIGIAFAIIAALDTGIKDAAMGLIYAAGAILSLGIALALFNIILPNPEEAMAPMLVVGGIALAFALMGRGAKEIKEGAQALLWASLAIIVVGLSFQLMNLIIPPEFATDIMNYTPLLVIGAVALTFRIIGEGAGEIRQGAIAMIFAGAALIVISIGFMMMASALGDNPWTTIGASLAFITGLGIAMGLAGLAAPFIDAGAIAMIIAGGALIAIGIGLMLMSKAFDMSGTQKMLVKDGDGKTALESILTAIGKGMMWWPWEVIGIASGSTSMILAGMALIQIGKGLESFAKIAESLDLGKLGDNIAYMIGVLAVPFDKIGRGGTLTVKDPTTGEEVNIKFSGGDWWSGNPVAKGIQAVQGMGGALTGIAKGVQNMANLRFPTGFDKEGQPTGYETIGGDAFAAVITNTQYMVGALAVPFARIGMGGKQKIINPITGSEEEVDFGTPAGDGIMAFFKSKSDVTKGIESVQGMGMALTNIAKGVADMAMLKMPTGFDAEGKATGYHTFNAVDALQVTTNTQMLVGALAGTFAQIGARPDAQDGSWWGGKSTIEKGIDLVKGFGTPLVNLAKGVQDMANLRFANKWDKDGKAIGWFEMNDIDKVATQVESNAIALIKALTNVFTTIGGGGDKTSSWWQGSTDFEKGIEIVSMISEPYLKLGNSIKSIAEAVMKHDITPVVSRIKSFVGVFTETGEQDSAILNSKKLFINSLANAFEKLGDSVPAIVGAVGNYKPELGNSFANMFIGPVDAKKPDASYNAQKLLWHAIGSSMTQTGESMPKIAEGINAIDFEKLVETRKMFEALGVLSNGGEPSDILAQMGESLSEALQNLAEMLGEFKNTVSEGNEAQAGAIAAVGDTVSKLGKSGGTGGKPGKAASAQPAGGDSSAVVTAIKNLQSVLTSKGIKVKTSLT